MSGALALLLLASAARAAAPRAFLGASWVAARGGFKDAPARLARLSAAGFRQVSLVPTYPYVAEDRIDFARGPSWEELGAAAARALDAGFAVTLKPHLDPLAYFPGYDPGSPEGRDWRARSAWRGSFDLDPMCADYREGLVARELAMLRGVLASRPGAPPVRLELGVELMKSVSDAPERWVELLAYARRERHRRGLDGRVLFSHDFEHHIEFPEELARRMTPRGLKALGRYVKGLDSVALSQYMDLTAAMPPGAADRRLPTADEVARALVLHEEAFRTRILQGLLGLSPAEIPTLVLGEFGVGAGGLRRPNEWSDALSPERERALSREIARGHEGLALYLGRERGRRALGATLWVTGRHYDVFGWDDPKAAVPAAAAADRAYLSGR